HRCNRISFGPVTATQPPQPNPDAVSTTQLQDDLRREGGASTRIVALLIELRRQAFITQSMLRQLLNPCDDLFFEVAAPSRRYGLADAALANQAPPPDN